MTWPWPHGALHVYALPGERLQAALEPFHEPIAATGFCAPQPPEFLHATITRFPWFLDDPTIPAIADVTAAVADVASSHAPFTVELSGPGITEYGVVVDAPPPPQWDALVDGVRAIPARLDPGREMPNRPYAPHVSVGYGVAEGDGEVLRAPLAAVPAPGPFVLDVREVHLLAVRQEPERGIFSWDPIAVLPLSGSGS
ncbi:2'-5' RNA ligase family protein [Pseudonocardia sp. CA-107938]|uniref:2'-5' RNA ligase family protein n=1 Tax=Pseudonocardia sp. CA-107938 TaxID=3240021 RepID=UPI003D91AC30